MGRSKKPNPETMHEFLESYVVDELKQLGKLLPVAMPTRKNDIIRTIYDYLRDPTNLKWLWGQLDTMQQAAISEVVYASTDRFDRHQFFAKYGQNPNWGAKLNKYRYDNTQPSKLHLFFYQNQMPRDLKETLRTFVPPPRAANIRVTTKLPASVPRTEYEWNNETGQSRKIAVEIPLMVANTEQMALHDIHSVLRLINAGKIRASAKTYRVTKAGANAIAGVLYGGDFYPPDTLLESYADIPLGPIKAFGLPLILQSGGLVELAGTKLQLTAAGKRALNAPPEKAIRTVWKKWQKTKILDEFNRIHTIKGQTGKGARYMTAVASRRSVIVEALKTCPVNKWIEFDEFSRFVQAAGYTFEVSRELWYLYIEDANYGSLGYDGYGGWNMVQGRYMLAFLFEYAATMGIIDVAYVPPMSARQDYGDQWGTDDLSCLSRYDGLLYFRLNNLGRWALGMADTYTPSPVETEKALKVLPNLDVVAVGRVSPGDKLFLESFALPATENVWKIDRAKLLTALENGQKIAEIQTFLKAKSGADLPNPVAILLTEAAEHIAGLRDKGEAWLIEAKDSMLAQLVANDGKLRALCLLAGDRYIVVPAKSKAAFRRNLRKLGYGVSK